MPNWVIVALMASGVVVGMAVFLTRDRPVQLTKLEERSSNAPLGYVKFWCVKDKLVFYTDRIDKVSTITGRFLAVTVHEAPGCGLNAYRVCVPVVSTSRLNAGDIVEIKDGTFRVILKSLEFKLFIGGVYETTRGVLVRQDEILAVYRPDA